MKLLIQQLFRLFGFEIRRRRAEDHTWLGPERGSLRGVLEQIRKVGFMPGTVIDVGAAVGSFTRSCHSVFPAARYLLLEPLEEYLPSLEKVVRDIPGVRYECAVATANGDPVAIHVHPDLVGSSLYREVEKDTTVNGIQRDVRAVTLDRWVHDQEAVPPYLIKIDVQGAEIDVLAGGEATLRESEVVIVEVSLFRFYEHGPLCGNVIDYMKSKGFVPYDLFDLQYRPIDGALSQVDLIFVRDEGLFRQVHSYATPEQRHRQNQRVQSYLRHSLSK